MLFSVYFLFLFIIQTSIEWSVIEYHSYFPIIIFYRKFFPKLLYYIKSRGLILQLIGPAPYVNCSKFNIKFYKNLILLVCTGPYNFYLTGNKLIIIKICFKTLNLGVFVEESTGFISLLNS